MGIHDGHREKMRRRFLETGLEGFADHEALELLLYYAIPRRDTNPIAHALMERYDSLSGVLNAPVEDLEKVEGIGESAAILLSLVSRLSRKARIADASQETILNSSERAGAYLLERFAGERRELVFLLCLDRKGRLLACKRLAEGDVASADLNIRKVVEMALLTSASAVILAHNHPSGVAGPPPATRPPPARWRRPCGPSASAWWTISWWRTGTSSPWRTAATCWGKEGAGSPFRTPTTSLWTGERAQGAWVGVFCHVHAAVKMTSSSSFAAGERTGENRRGSPSPPSFFVPSLFSRHGSFDKSRTNVAKR